MSALTDWDSAAVQALRTAAAEQRRLAEAARTNNGQAEHEDFADWLEERADLLAGGSMGGGEQDEAQLGLVSRDGQQGLGTCSPEPTTDEAIDRLRAYLTVAPKWDEVAATWDQTAGVSRSLRVSDLKKLLVLAAAAPLLGPKPLLDQQAVADVVYSAVREQAGPAIASHVGTDMLRRLLELARPMPTREQIARAMHAQQFQHEWKQESYGCNFCAERFLYLADAVLALLNGAGL